MLLTDVIVLMVYSNVIAVGELALEFAKVTDAATACADFRSTVTPTESMRTSMAPTIEPRTLCAFELGPYILLV
jgi:hypothetical protein